MRQIISPEKHKNIIAVITAGVSLFGLEAASGAIRVYQVNQFVLIAFASYLFLVFLQSFIFDLHLRRAKTMSGMERSLIRAFRERFHYFFDFRHFLHYQNYLLLPGIVFWSAVALLYLNPFDQLIKQLVIGLSVLALTVSFWYLKTVFYSHRESGHHRRQMIFLVKIFASYLSFTAAFGIAKYFAVYLFAPKSYFAFSAIWFATVIFGLTILLLYQALFQHHESVVKMFPLMVLSSVIMGALAYLLYLFWPVNYFTGAIALAAIYNTIWGIIHHKYIDHDMSRELMYEYFAILFLVLVIVFTITNFSERI